MKWTPIIAMLLLTFMACFALALGIDGAVFITASAGIAGLGGFELKSHLVKKEDKTKYVEEYLKLAGYTEQFIAALVKKAKGGE